MSFDEDLGKHEEKEKDNKVKNKKNKKRKNVEESGQLQENDRKKSRKELMKKTREEAEPSTILAADAEAMSMGINLVAIAWTSPLCL